MDWELGNALTSWQELPDQRDQMNKMQATINRAPKEISLVIMIRQEVLKNIDKDESFITPGVDKAYGTEEGCLIKFSTSDGLRFKVGEHRDRKDENRGYLFLEKDGQRLGYFKPKFIVKMQARNE